MSHHHDVERPLEQRGEEALIEAVQGRPSEVGRLEALKELARRRSPRLSALLSAVLLDDGLPGDLRAVAAAETGKQATPGSEPALLAALQSGPPLVVRRAAESLGRIGGLDALRALRTNTSEEEPAVARAVSFARSLISYRLGLGSDLLETPSAGAILNVDDPDLIQVQATPLGADEVERMAPRYRLEVPGVAVSAREAVQLRCGTNEFLLMPHETMDVLAGRNAVLGVVLKRAQSLEYFALHLYLLCHRKDEGTLSLFGVRPDGTLTLFGEMDLDARERSFWVKALNTPYGPPLDIQGRIDTAADRVVLTKAVVNRRLSRSQKRGQIPTKIEIRA